MAGAPRESELRRANDEIAELRADLRREQLAKNDLRMRARELDRKLKIKEELPKDVETLQRQLTAAKTRIRNSNFELKHLAQSLDDARTANPVSVPKANYRKLQKVFHPDAEARVSAARKAELTEAFQIFNAIKFKIRD